MLYLKPGVRVFGIRPELVLALNVADRVYNNHNYDLTVTSVVDSQHSRTSLHYSGAAADLRTRGISPDKHMILVNEIQSALGQDFDVILEVDHIHLEFQPKGPHRVAMRESLEV